MVSVLEESYECNYSQWAYEEMMLFLMRIYIRWGYSDEEQMGWWRRKDIKRWELLVPTNLKFNGASSGGLMYLIALSMKKI